MERSGKLVWAVLAFMGLFVAAIALGAYQIHVFEVRFQQLEATLAREVDALERTQAQATAALTARTDQAVADLDAKLGGRIEIVEDSVSKTQEENVKRFSSLSGQLTQLESSQTQKLQTLEEQLSHIEVSSTDFSGIIEDVVKGVLALRTDLGSGSGAIVDERGYIVTNFHVVNGIKALSIYGYNGTIYAGALVATNADRDLALLKINANQDFDELDLDDSDQVRVGQKVIAVGNPGGLDFSVTEGIVSNVNRRDSQGTPLLQIDVPINPGNSGGPLVNTKGRIVGITTKKVAGYEGLGFAIASNTVKDFIEAGLP